MLHFAMTLLGARRNELTTIFFKGFRPESFLPFSYHSIFQGGTGSGHSSLPDQEYSQSTLRAKAQATHFFTPSEKLPFISFLFDMYRSF
jgi:hypothetical protein